MFELGKEDFEPPTDPYTMVQFAEMSSEKAESPLTWWMFNCSHSLIPCGGVIWWRKGSKL